ncbi:hypothetical protein PCO80_08970 [Pectobacteriaceae bacterium C80]|nr:hypothetical protein PCO80_08970 [Pectobacteriaceae bacterium C80]
MPGPISAGAFRRHLPNLHRPFRLPLFSLLSPLAFVASTMLVYWSGWSVNVILLPILIVAWVLYALFAKKGKHHQRDVGCAWWLLVYYIAIMVISGLGTFGGTGLISSPMDMILSAIVSLVCYYWGVSTSLAAPKITEEENETLVTGQINQEGYVQ